MLALIIVLILLWSLGRRHRRSFGFWHRPPFGGWGMGPWNMGPMGGPGMHGPMGRGPMDGHHRGRW